MHRHNIDGSIVGVSMSQFASRDAFSAAKADELIAAEIGRQDRMWGATNERVDISRGQLFKAAVAQQDLLLLKEAGFTDEGAEFAARGRLYPKDWSGFRDYGSDVANLVVAAAFIRQEIVRKIRNGESTFRSSRDSAAQPYEADQPNVIEP